jgi:hypothetical protein
MDVLMTRFSGQSFAMLVFMLPVATASADALHDELRVCRDLPDDDARLICTVVATGAAVDLSQEDLFGKTGDEVGRTVEEATGSERIDSLSATVTKLQQYSYGKVLITLDNGQLWKQIDTSNLRLRAGDAVVIERAALGSFMLKKQGSKRSMRVSRED